MQIKKVNLFLLECSWFLIYGGEKEKNVGKWSGTILLRHCHVTYLQL